jgi:hypothetical protein
VPFHCIWAVAQTQIHKVSAAKSKRFIVHECRAGQGAAYLLRDSGAGSITHQREREGFLFSRASEQPYSAHNSETRSCLRTYLLFVFHLQHVDLIAIDRQQ